MVELQIVVLAVAAFEPVEAEPGIDRLLVAHTDRPPNDAIEELAAALDMSAAVSPPPL